MKNIDTTLTCSCSCMMVKFTFDPDDRELYFTPFAYWKHDIVWPATFRTRLRMAVGLLFNKYPERTMCISCDDAIQFRDFLSNAIGIMEKNNHDKM